MIITDKNIVSQKSTDVSTVDEAKEIIDKLTSELDSCPNGVGLAAIQIGIPKRIAVIKYAGETINLVNPELIELEDEFVFYKEGCLSIPGKFINTKRYKGVVIKNKIIDGDSFRDETQYYYYDEGSRKDKNLIVIAVQHELDHFNGKTIEDIVVKSEPFRAEKKVGRNDPCPCKSGKKYKKCCGKNG